MGSASVKMPVSPAQSGRVAPMLQLQTGHVSCFGEGWDKTRVRSDPITVARADTADTLAGHSWGLHFNPQYPSHTHRKACENPYTTGEPCVLSLNAYCLQIFVVYYIVQYCVMYKKLYF